MLAVATKVKDLHQSKYAHRNINSETVWVSIAFQPTNCTEEDIVVDLRGEEISEDLVKVRNLGGLFCGVWWMLFDDEILNLNLLHLTTATSTCNT